MTLKVLAIDDSTTMRGLIANALGEAGFDVTLAEDGLDGLSKLDLARPDVVVTDINMPNLDGFGFVAAVRKRPELRGLPILILTTESAQDLKEKARGMGASGWIVKPFDDKSLISAINRVAVA